MVSFQYLLDSLATVAQNENFTPIISRKFKLVKHAWLLKDYTTVYCVIALQVDLAWIMDKMLEELLY